jgi:hypothetical protein
MGGASNQVTRGNKLSMLTQVGSLIVMLVTIVLAWGDVKQRIALTEQRITQLEGLAGTTATKRESDNTALLTLAGELKAQSVAIKGMSDTLIRFEAKIGELERVPARR